MNNVKDFRFFDLEDKLDYLHFFEWTKFDSQSLLDPSILLILNALKELIFYDVKYSVSRKLNTNHQNLIHSTFSFDNEYILSLGRKKKRYRFLIYDYKNPNQEIIFEKDLPESNEHLMLTSMFQCTKEITFIAGIEKIEEKHDYDLNCNHIIYILYGDVTDPNSRISKFSLFSLKNYPKDYLDEPISVPIYKFIYLEKRKLVLVSTSIIDQIIIFSIDKQSFSDPIKIDSSQNFPNQKIRGFCYFPTKTQKEEYYPSMLFLTTEARIMKYVMKDNTIIDNSIFLINSIPFGDDGLSEIKRKMNEKKKEEEKVEIIEIKPIKNFRALISQNKEVELKKNEENLNIKINEPKLNFFQEKNLENQSFNQTFPNDYSNFQMTSKNNQNNKNFNEISDINIMKPKQNLDLSQKLKEKLNNPTFSNPLAINSTNEFLIKNNENFQPMFNKTQGSQYFNPSIENPIQANDYFKSNPTFNQNLNKNIIDSKQILKNPEIQSYNQQSFPIYQNKFNSEDPTNIYKNNFLNNHLFPQINNTNLNFSVNSNLNFSLPASNQKNNLSLHFPKRENLSNIKSVNKNNEDIIKNECNLIAKSTISKTQEIIKNLKKNIHWKNIKQFYSLIQSNKSFANELSKNLSKIIIENDSFQIFLFVYENLKINKNLIFQKKFLDNSRLENKMIKIEKKIQNLMNFFIHMNIINNLESNKIERNIFKKEEKKIDLNQKIVKILRDQMINYNNLNEDMKKINEKNLMQKEEENLKILENENEYLTEKTKQEYPKNEALFLFSFENQRLIKKQIETFIINNNFYVKKIDHSINIQEKNNENEIKNYSKEKSSPYMTYNHLYSDNTENILSQNSLDKRFRLYHNSTRKLN